MAIVKMNKFTLLAFESDRKKLLEELQKLEEVQFINLQSQDVLEDQEDFVGLDKVSLDSSYAKFEEDLSKIKFTMEFLKPYVSKKSGLGEMLSDKKQMSYEEINKYMTNSSWKVIYNEIKGKEERLNSINNELTKIESEIDLLKAWINFDAPFKLLKNLKSAYFLGSFPKQYEEELIDKLNKSEYPTYYEVISKNNSDVSILVITNIESRENISEELKQVGFSAFPVIYDETASEKINSLKSDHKNLLDEEKSIKESLITYNDKMEELEIAYEFFSSLIVRELASNNFLKTNKIIAISGWIKKDSNEILEETVRSILDSNYYMTFSEVEDKEVEKVPIRLKNGSFASSFEGLVEMYSLPQYSEVDPTPILSVFYFIFFGMMLSDAGYGLIMVCATSYALWKVKDPEKRKFFKLLFFAGISTVIWGAIYGSWFGDLFPEYFGINVPYLLNPATGIMEIFIMSLVFGFVHVFVGLGIKAYVLIRAGAIKDMVYDVLTWYSTLIGAVFMLLGIGGVLGKVLLFGGLIALLLTQGRASESIGGKIGGGVYGVYGITGYLGDIVSYSRLLALGLATGFIANALNLIVNLIPSPFSYIISPILFIGLHLFNLLINALGSYVHAARLQYLEFFSKFYEGGGRKFTPFKLSDIFIKITK